MKVQRKTNDGVRADSGRDPNPKDPLEGVRVPAQQRQIIPSYLTPCLEDADSPFECSAVNLSIHIKLCLDLDLLRRSRCLPSVDISQCLVKVQGRLSFSLLDGHNIPPF